MDRRNAITLIRSGKFEAAEEVIRQIEVKAADRLLLDAHFATARRDWVTAASLWRQILASRPTASRRAQVEEVLPFVDFHRKYADRVVYECNFCNGLRWLTRSVRPHVMCERPGCRSLERARLMKLHLDKLNLSRTARILHFAPEPSLMHHLLRLVGRENYLCADIDDERYDFSINFKQIELCAPAIEIEGSFDYIIHSHVLEHLPCNHQDVLRRLFRLLRPGGRQIFAIPILPGRYAEDLTPRTAENRRSFKQRFGQVNHVRRFGADDLEQQFEPLFDFSPYRAYSVRHHGEETLIRHNIPDVFWDGLSMCTIFDVAREEARGL
ncbi:methyltransferase domain-containing protein [Sediminicoccus sp. BL-A-41-H5]|uniref:methyltransferase domain-containing protein n=1 Tax=Sediminicoccus sp. BL-A-41-H5 TaxID=3421106 RepID=UPI003D67909B